MSCGVETITAPFSGTLWAMVSWASPVPGGISSTSTSSGAQRTSFIIWVSARLHHGPAPDHGLVFLDQETDRHGFQAVFFDGLELLAVAFGLLGDAQQARNRWAINIGIQQAHLQTQLRQASARLTATVDLPTPPLPLATAMICPTPAMPCGARLAAAEGARAGWLMVSPGVPHAPSVPPSPTTRPRTAKTAASPRRAGVPAGSTRGGTSRAKPTWPSSQHQALDHVLLHDAAAADRVDHLVERLENIVSRHGCYALLWGAPYSGGQL